MVRRNKLRAQELPLAELPEHVAVRLSDTPQCSCGVRLSCAREQRVQHSARCPDGQAQPSCVVGLVACAQREHRFCTWRPLDSQIKYM